MGQWLELSRGKKHVKRRPILVQKSHRLFTSRALNLCRVFLQWGHASVRQCVSDTLAFNSSHGADSLRPSRKSNPADSSTATSP